MAIFSILLLTSRLVPFSWAHQDEEKLAQGNDFRAELFQRPEVREQLDTLVQLIKSYSDSGTYFVRKISAQALLPLLQFGSYIPEVTSCCKALVERAQQKDLRQNEAHGLMVRIEIFLSAYFKYRSIAVALPEQAGQFEQDEQQILAALFQFQ